MNYVHWRNLVGVAYTEDEAKALAAETEVSGWSTPRHARPGRWGAGARGQGRGGCGR